MGEFLDLTASIHGDVYESLQIMEQYDLEAVPAERLMRAASLAFALAEELRAAALVAELARTQSGQALEAPTLHSGEHLRSA